MKLDPFYLPLPKKTLDHFVRLFMEPIEKGQSLVLLFEAKAGRRALPKFFMANLGLFKEQIRKGEESYLFFYIDPPELTEQTPYGYLLLFYQQLISPLPPFPESYLEVFAHLKKAVSQKVKEKELIFFLNRFDGLNFLTTSLANNLKSIWQIDKTKIHFVFLPLNKMDKPELLNNYGDLKEAIIENAIHVPPLSDEDIKYIIDRYAHFLNYPFSEKQAKAIRDISRGNPFLIKTGCRLLSQEGKLSDPQSFLDHHYQIQLIREEDSGIQKALTLNLETGQLLLDGVPIRIQLSGNEYNLLSAFIKNRNEILSRDQVAEILWGKDSYEKYSDWAIDQFIYQLRNKLTAYGLNQKIQTVRGKGYRFQ